MKRGLVVLAVLGGVARAEPPDPERLEPAVLPAVAYDSDIGLGFGAVVTLVRFHEGVLPYRWRLQAQLYLTVKEEAGGGVELPYHDDYLQLDVPGLLDDRLRASLKLAFGRSTIAGFYGLGSRITDIGDGGPDMWRYRRTIPEVEAGARVRVSREMGKLDAVLGARLAYADIDPYPGSVLDFDASEGLVWGAEPHVHAQVSGGMLLDTRDHESVPTRGMLHELTLRAGVGLGAAFGYGGIKASARGFAPIAGEHLVLAARAVVDALVGRPPFYELALGGATTLRGVRAGRFHGQVKAYGNLEVRASLFSFSLGSQRFGVGLLGFLDGGRVFDDADVDNRGIAVGTGGGLRLRWGEHFVVRVDVAVSPTEDTSGLYIDAGHIF